MKSGGSVRSLGTSDGQDFLAGGGEMGALIRAFDWASTPIGVPETWPASLRATIRLMLNSRHPMFIWWGPELIQLYNDAYRLTMGPQMHPAALGHRGRESWPDIWPIIGPQIEHVMAGNGSTWNEDQLVPINRNGEPEDVWWTYGYSPIDLDDQVGGVLVVCNDVTEMHLKTEAFKDSTRRLAEQFERAPGFIAILRGPDHVFELANAAYRTLIGGRAVIGLPVSAALPEIEGQGFRELLDEVYRTGQPFVGRRVPIKLVDEAGAQNILYLDFVYQAVTEADGTISGIFVEGQDVTAHVLAEQRLALINEELRHRVKNTLAIVGAVAGQTLRKAAGPDAMRLFNSRLAAFGAAHDALANRRFSEGNIEEVIRLAIKPHMPDDDRYAVSGPRLELGSKQAVSLALTMHELATNAVKYGALSNERGRVAISWGLDQSDIDTFFLEWKESGGPAVTRPETTGFGSRMMRDLITSDFGGIVEVLFEPAGLVFRLNTSAENLHSGKEPEEPIELRDLL